MHVSIKFSLISLNQFFLILLLFISCVREQIIPPSSNVAEEKLVVIAYLTPGDSIRVYLSRSVAFGKLLDEDTLNVLNATISIRDENGNTQMLSLDPSARSVYVCSQNEFRIVPGKRYMLHASAPGLPAISTWTRVPSEMAVWKTTSISETNDGGRSEFNGTWDAVEDEEELDYSVFVYRAAEPLDILYGNESITPIDAGFSVQKQFSLGSNLKAVLVTRTQALGQFSKMTQLTLEMKNYYTSAGFFDIISGFKGVVPQFTNIENGLGVFGSYLLHEKSLN